MKPAVSIVIPAFNEKDRMPTPLGTLIEFARERGDIELVVVDDGSSDGTADIARSILAEAAEVPSKVIAYETNKGKGYAVRTGLKAATADTGLFTDADLSTPITEMAKLVDPIRAGKIDVGFGSRALDRTLIGTHQPWTREQGGKAVNLMIRTLAGFSFRDTQCGFKAFNLVKFRPLLDLMTIDRFGFDVEFLYVAKYHGLRIEEIPVRWNDVAGSKVSPVRDTRRMFSELMEIRRNARKGRYDLK